MNLSGSFCIISEFLILNGGGHFVLFMLVNIIIIIMFALRLQNNVNSRGFKSENLAGPYNEE